MTRWLDRRLPIASLKIPQTFVAGTGGGLPRAGMSQERSSVIVQAICARRRQNNRPSKGV